MSDLNLHVKKRLLTNFAYDMQLTTIEETEEKARKSTKEEAESQKSSRKLFLNNRKTGTQIGILLQVRLEKLNLVLFYTFSRDNVLYFMHY